MYLINPTDQQNLKKTRLFTTQLSRTTAVKYKKYLLRMIFVSFLRHATELCTGTFNTGRLFVKNQSTYRERESQQQLVKKLCS